MATARGEVLEPWLTDQMVRPTPRTLAQEPIKAVETGATKFVPKQWGSDLLRVDAQHPGRGASSRQIWWGHQIPAWFGPDGQVFVAEEEAEAVAAGGAAHLRQRTSR